MAKATIDDVAELAGVSIKTVSRVFNREPNVRPSTREKVNKAIAQLNYRPNLSARNLASDRAHLIVLVYEDPSTYELPSAGYVIQLQVGTMAACKKHNYELLIHPCDYNDKDVGAQLKAVIDQARPDGVIIAAPLSNMPKIVRPIAATNTPYVRLSSGVKSQKEFSVGTDDREACAGMTRYLASLGHERIAFITGHSDHKAVLHRFEGYKDGLAESGLEFSEQLVAAGDNSIGSGEGCAKRLLQLQPRPTAIFAANDDMAVGVIRAAHRMGVDVPAELSVAGYDDITLASQIYPTLTTIHQPLAEMAEHAAEAIISMARKNEIEPEIDIVEGELKVRESTGPAPA
jgi:LacI family transcriptional regulator